MATETLHFENARIAQQLFNSEPKNLQHLETQLGVRQDARRAIDIVDSLVASKIATAMSAMLRQD